MYEVICGIEINGGAGVSEWVVVDVAATLEEAKELGRRWMKRMPTHKGHKLVYKIRVKGKGSK
jgi:hypothetical protein